MESFPQRLEQELEDLLLNPDFHHDYDTVERVIEHAKVIIGIGNVPRRDEPHDTIRNLLNRLNNRELISLYLRLCEDGILDRADVNRILVQVRQEFIEYGDGLVWVDHGIQELKEGIQQAVNILDALGFDNTKNELQTASSDLTRGVWDAAVWRSSKAIEGVCKEVARRYKDQHGGTINEWRGMNAVQDNLTGLGYWRNEEPLKKLVDHLRTIYRNPTSHFDEDQTQLETSRIFSEEGAYMVFQISHLICLSMLRRLS